jgi:hypothetical protein
MNWKEFERKRLQPTLRYYPGICLEVLGKNHEKPQSGLPVSGPRFESGTSRTRMLTARLTTQALPPAWCRQCTDTSTSYPLPPASEGSFVNHTQPCEQPVSCLPALLLRKICAQQNELRWVISTFQRTRPHLTDTLHSHTTRVILKEDTGFYRGAYNRELTIKWCWCSNQSKEERVLDYLRW